MRRTISDEDRAAAKRLKALWDAKRAERKFTQEDAAGAFGWSNNSSVSQYLNGVIALNPEATWKFAQFLQVDPAEIRPDLERLLTGSLGQDALDLARAWESMPDDLKGPMRQLIHAYAGLSQEALDLASSWQRLPDTDRDYVQKLVTEHPARGR